MAESGTNLTTRVVIILLIVAGILEGAICVAAYYRGHRQAEAAVAEAKNEAEQARKEADARVQAAEEEKAGAAKRLDLAKASFDEQSTKRAAAEKEAERLAANSTPL